MSAAYEHVRNGQVPDTMEAAARDPHLGRTRGPRRRPVWQRAGLAAALLLALAGPAAPTEAQEGCRVPSDEQIDAGGALESVMLVLHGLQDQIVPLEQGVAFGDPGPCPGGSLDAFRGPDMLGWVLEVSGPAQPDLCSPNDPPIMELPLRTTRCVDPSTTVASRSARVAYGELVSRAPFALLLPSGLPDELAPHWATMRVTDRRATSGPPRQFGTIVRFRGAEEEPWLVLLEATGGRGDWLMDTLRADAPSVPLRGMRAAVLDSLPEYEGPGTGLLWEESGLRLVLFGTYSAPQLAQIANGLALRPAAPGPAPTTQ